MKKLPAKKFQKKVEDFECENCGARVSGNGFTNHCPQCLWSKHVDVNPGDRAEICGGMMEPIGVEFTKGEYSVIQKCQKCKFVRRNKISKDDNFDALLKIKPKI